MSKMHAPPQYGLVASPILSGLLEQRGLVHFKISNLILKDGKFTNIILKLVFLFVGLLRVSN